VRDVFRQVGVLVARLHDNEIIHSDLTTSNFMLHDGGVRVIDFGLSFVSAMVEDKAVDLYVQKKAFNLSDPGKEELLEVVMQAYAETLLARLKKVRARGRKRSMAG
jgi:TP53 regulating kinase-like protein